MSAAAKVELYVSKKPYIKEALAEGLINYSALGRQICREKDIESLSAVKTALSRYEDHISSQRDVRREEVEEILSNTEMEVRPGVKVVKAEAKNAIIKAETKNGHTSVLSGEGMALISLESSERLEETPGVLEFILSSLAAEGINVEQMISCREDTHLVVSAPKASEALDILRNRIS